MYSNHNGLCVGRIGEVGAKVQACVEVSNRPFFLDIQNIEGGRSDLRNVGLQRTRGLRDYIVTVSVTSKCRSAIPDHSLQTTAHMRTTVLSSELPCTSATLLPLYVISSFDMYVCVNP